MDRNAENEKSLSPSGVPRAVSVLALRNAVFFPRQVSPLTVGRESSIKAVDESMKDDGAIVIVAQTDGAIENPTEQDIYWVGTLAKVLKSFHLADGTRSILVQGLRRVRILSVLHAEPYLRAVVRDIEEKNETGPEIEAIAANLKSQFKKVVDLSPQLSEDQLTLILNMDEPEAVTDMISAFLPVGVEERQEILEQETLRVRGEKAMLMLSKFLQKLELGTKIQSEVQEEINKSQREYYLREQLKAIRKELGEEDENVGLNDLKKRIEDKKSSPGDD